MKKSLFQIILALLVLMPLSSRGFAQSEIVTTVAGNGEACENPGGDFATSVSLCSPLGISVDIMGNIYFADSKRDRIRKVSPTGLISTVAGKGSSGYSGDGGPAVLATLNRPGGTAIDSQGNLYISEIYGNRIRKVDPTGIITTVAGTGTAGYNGDGGPATSAQISTPQGIAVDAAGSLFIADAGNHRIRRVDAAGKISTVAGTGLSGYNGDGRLATSAQLANPQGVALDAEGNLFIADYHNNRVRKVTPAGTISTIAGDGTAGFGGDDGLATMAQLSGPQSVAIDAAGSLFITDYFNNRIRKVDLEGIISTIIGTDSSGYSGDGGPAISAMVYNPLDVAVDANGSLYFADYGNNRVREIQDLTAITFYFPEVMVGGGYSTHVTILNMGSTECSSELILTDSMGNPLSAGAAVNRPDGETQELTGSSFPVLLPPGGVGFVTLTALDPYAEIQVGWARLVSDQNVLASVATYEYADAEGLQVMVGVLPSLRLQSATIPVDNSEEQNKQLAYAIVNPSGQALKVKMTLVGQDGVVLENLDTLPLGPREHFARYLWQDMGTKNFKGSLVLQGENLATFISVALLEKQGILTVIPVVAGKLPGVPE